MPQAASRKSATVGASRESVKKPICSHAMISVVSYLSKRYGLLPCFCDHDPLRMMKQNQASILSNSSNALWSRDRKQPRNNSTTMEIQRKNSTHSKIFRIFRRKKKRTITARSVVHKRKSSTAQVNIDRPLPSQNGTEQSSDESTRFISQDNSDDDQHSITLQPTNSSFTTEYQNINATSRTSQSTTPQRKIKKMNSPKKNKQNTSKRPKRTSKRKTTLSNKTRISKSNSKTHGRSPFPDPTMFRFMPHMKDSDEITTENIHENHLCCKPITSVKGLSTNDQKKLLEHDYLTLISLLPTYIGSQGHFVEKIRERTNISHDAALELERLMNEWSSTRLFIGTNSHYKTLTQKI